MISGLTSLVTELLFSLFGEKIKLDKRAGLAGLEGGCCRFLTARSSEGQWEQIPRSFCSAAPPPRTYLGHNNSTNYVGYLELVERVYENKILEGIIKR